MIRQIASTGRPGENSVEDQEIPTSLGEPGDQPDPDSVPVDADEAPVARGRRLSTAALLGFCAVLVVFATLMTALYVRERGGRADYDRLLAASNAQLNAAQDQLNSARALPTLDPKAYEAIRKCVQQGAEDEKLREELQKYTADMLPSAFPTAFVTTLPTGFPTTFVTTLPSGFPIGSLRPGVGDPKVCEEAATYLK
jgi:hypothetical protein